MGLGIGSALRLDRRVLLRTAVTATASTVGAALLAACGGSTTAPTTTPTVNPVGATGTGGTGTVSVTGVTGPTNAVSTTGASGAAATPGIAGTSSVGSPTAASASTGISLTPAALPDANGKIPGGSASVPDAYLQAPAPFKTMQTPPGRNGSKVTAMYLAYNPPPSAKSDNTYWQELEKRLNVSFEPVIAPAGTAYAEKVAAFAAGGDFPDITTVDLEQAPDIGRIVQQGAFTELSSYLTGDALKEYRNLATFPPQIWKNASIGGKLYGVPRPQFIQSRALAYRLDWAEKFGPAPPTTAEEFFNLMVKFVKNDPDGNGQADTYGLASTITGDPYCLGYLQWMFRVPNQWRRNADGTLTYYIETDEFRQMLAFAQRLYTAGIYHPDAATITTSQGKDLFNAGKVGCALDGIGALPGNTGFRTKAKTTNPAARVGAMIPPSPDGKAAVTYNRPGFFATSSIPIKVGRDPERVKELLRVVDWFAAPSFSDENIFKNYGIEGVHHTLKDGVRILNDNGKAQIADFSNLSNGPITLCYTNGQPDDAVFMQTLVRNLAALGIDNPTTGYYSATNATKTGELTRLHIDRTSAMVQGRDPLTALEAYVKDWRGRGGDAIRKEYETAIKGQ